MTETSAGERALPTAPAAKLYGPTAVVVCTVLFSPLVGGAMAALNWHRAGDRPRALKTLGIALAAMALIGVAAALFPASWEGAARGATIGTTVGLAMALKREQKALVDAHVAAGGATAVPVVPALVGIVLLGTLLAAMLSQGPEGA